MGITTGHLVCALYEKRPFFLDNIATKEQTFEIH